MALDPTRAALVTKEYRYSITEDSSIKALYPNASEIVLETSLDSTSGAALSSALFGVTSVYARQFEVVIEDVLFPEDFLVSPNRYVVNFSRHPAGGTTDTYTVIKAEIDYFAGTTTLTVRG